MLADDRSENLGEARAGEPAGDLLRRLRHAEASSAWLGRVLDHCGEILIFDERSLRLIRANQRACQYLSYSKEEMDHLTLFDLVPELDHEGMEALLAPLHSGEKDHLVLRTQKQRRDGTIFPAEVHLYHEDNLLLALLYDLSEHYFTEQANRFLAEAGALLANSLDYRTTLTSLAQIAVPHFADWCIVDMVEEARSQGPGRPAEEPLPRGPGPEPPGVPSRSGPAAGAAPSLHRLVVAHRDPALGEVAQQLHRFPPSLEVKEGVAQALRTGLAQLYPSIDAVLAAACTHNQEHLRLVLRLGVRSGMCVPLRCRGRTLGVITFMMGESGRSYGHKALALAEDLARRAALAVDNARLYREAQEAIRLREEFLSIASHELRSPLTPLQLQIQMMLRSLRRGVTEDLLPERLTPRLENCERNSKRLGKMIQDLLDVSRIRAGRLVIQPEALDAAQVVRDVAGRLVAELPQAGGQLLLQADVPCPGKLDRLRLEQVVQNLLGNAIQYGRGKPIRLSVTPVTPRAAGERQGVRIEVADRGIGISPAELARIFDRFERATDERRRQGLGLGLYIARQIVSAMGGTIAVSSQEGVGSTFTVDLPL